MDDMTHSRLRVSDSDRDAVVTELGQHFPGRPPLARALVPVLIAAVLVTAALTVGARHAGWHHQWGAGVGWWPVWWLIPLLAVRLLWWGRRPGRARSWR
jgi:hypothetical protein